MNMMRYKSEVIERADFIFEIYKKTKNKKHKASHRY